LVRPVTVPAVAVAATAAVTGVAVLPAGGVATIS
jgi:hypothetical protein